MKDTRRPYVTCSITTSLDGYIDDLSGERLVISSEEHFQYVDEMRAVYDAILVGAETIRRDNPRLMIKSPGLRDKRIGEGSPADPARVTIVSKGEIEGCSNFFASGETQKVLYCPDARRAHFEKKLPSAVEVVPYFSARLDPQDLLEDLFKRGIGRLLVEGGEQIHTMFMQSGLIDELQLAVGPLFVGEKDAPRFVGPGSFSFNKYNRLNLDSVEKKGDTAVLRYLVRGK